MNMKKIYEVVKIKQVIKEVAEEEKFIIRCPQDGANVAAEFIGDEDREVFFILCMNTKNHVVAVHRCHVGGTECESRCTAGSVQERHPQQQCLHHLIASASDPGRDPVKGGH
ncbi:hypothetical protein BACI349Y_790001 [Bacillus sp. 349Y]|nr:hypothetical protein BACI349Y_790001 [Bacillus sp. 349Y]